MGFGGSNNPILVDFGNKEQKLIAAKNDMLRSMHGRFKEKPKMEAHDTSSLL